MGQGSIRFPRNLLDLSKLRTAPFLQLISNQKHIPGTSGPQNGQPQYTRSLLRSEDWVRMNLFARFREVEPDVKQPLAISTGSKSSYVG